MARLALAGFSVAFGNVSTSWTSCGFGLEGSAEVQVGKEFLVTLQNDASFAGAKLSVSGRDHWFPMFEVTGDLRAGVALPDGMGFLQETARDSSKIQLKVLLSRDLPLVTRDMDLFFHLKGNGVACTRLTMRFDTFKQALVVPPYYPDAVRDSIVREAYPLGATIDFEWDSKCTVGNKAEVTSMQFDGDVLGQPITINAKGNFHEAVQEGTQFSMVMSAMGIPLMRKTGDWCGDSTIELPMGMGQVQMQGLGCPGKPGPFETKEALTLSPRMIFKQCSVQLSAIAPGGDQYFCITLKGSIKANQGGENLYI